MGLFMDFNKSLSYENVSLQVIHQSDFDSLFKLASDPEIWDQHNDQ